MPTKTTSAKKLKKIDERVGAVGTKQRIVDAATDLFLQKGYAKTSLDIVAKAANVTKPTVYSYFKSKREVLLAVTQTLQDLANEVALPLKSTGDVDQDMRRFAKVFVQNVATPSTQAWHRLAMTEEADHPEVGDVVFASGPAKVIKAIKEFIKEEVQQGRLNCPDAEIAAEQFIGMLHGIEPIRMMTGQPPLSKAKKTRFANAAVDTFLKAFATVE